ncbi:SDR family oxidoreductase [Nocardia gamkensis]|uniref:SDR family oxidoreductase n=1 Tax=Nocardia gamkensis TaxID=352869 RepID=UPI003402F0B9
MHSHENVVRAGVRHRQSFGLDNSRLADHGCEHCIRNGHHIAFHLASNGLQRGYGSELLSVQQTFAPMGEMLPSTARCARCIGLPYRGCRLFVLGTFDCVIYGVEIREMPEFPALGRGGTLDLGIAGRTAVVLGGGGGLGGAIAEKLAAEGAEVAVADIHFEAAAARSDLIVAAAGRAIPVAWDIADLDVIEDKVAEIERTLGPVDILVNNTGGPSPAPVLGLPSTVWLDHFRSMVLSVIAVSDRLVPGMRTRGWGRVITSASSGVVAPIPNLGLSNGLRAALLGWSKTLAREVASDGVTCNIVVPGRIGTGRVERLDRIKAEAEGRTVEEVTADSVATIPIGRYGDPSEYASTVAFLASVPASYITGSVVRVDGGLIPSL